MIKKNKSFSSAGLLSTDKRSAGQGTIEYLVIMAIVIVIGLVVVGMLASINDSQSITQKNDKLKNLIGTGGISITESLLGEDGTGLISIKNNGLDTLTIQKVSTENRELSFDNKRVVTGNTTTFSLDDLDLDCPCNGQNQVSCAFTITILTQSGSQSVPYILNTECSQNEIIIPLTATEPLLCPTYAGLQNKDGNLIICDCNDLQSIENNLNASYLLGQNIDCSETLTWNSNYGFDPINGFSGNLFGNNKTISGLYEKLYYSEEIGYKEGGLFATIYDGNIQDLIMSDFNFQGGCISGAIVGANQYGNIKNITLSNGIIHGITNTRYLGNIAGITTENLYCPTNITTNNLTINSTNIDTNINNGCTGLIGDVNMAMAGGPGGGTCSIAHWPFEEIDGGGVDGGPGGA
ncbi:MAG: hypothetical protein WC915_03315 [archaeon]|jgi:hypothetical protein